METQKREFDAVPISNSSGQELVGFHANNSIQSHQTPTQNSSSVIFNFENSHGIHLGPVVNFGVQLSQQKMSPVSQQKSVVDPQALCDEDDKVYKKTPTIKLMMEDEERLSDGFLDHICENFGSRWRDVTILLEIDQLYVERMKEDFFDRGGTKEVVYQCLTKFFLDNTNKRTIGWFITFLWRNKFKSTVWAMREKFRIFKALQDEL